MVRLNKMVQVFGTSSVILLLLAWGNIAAADKLNELHAKELIDNEGLRALEYGKSQINFEDYTVIKQRQFGKSLYAALKQYDWPNFKDELLRRQFEVVLRGDGYPEDSSELDNAVKTLQNVAHERWVCERNNRQKCNMAYVPHIKAIFANTQDPNELLYYWREWREQMPTDVKTALQTYINYYRNTKRAPYANISGHWYSDYDDEQMLQMFDNVWENVLPLYKQLHAHLRHLLKVRYGNDIVPASGLIPHHLLQKATYQAWKKYSVLSNPYPEKRLPNLQAELDTTHFSTDKLINTSLQFFESLGFPYPRPEFLKTHLNEITYGGHDCKAKFNEFKTELHYCPQVNYKKLLQMHGYIARFEYDVIKSNLSYGLNHEAAPGFSEAIGEATILSVSNPKHLQTKLNLLHDYNYDAERNLNRLYRMAVHTLLTLPTYLVHEHLWVEIINGKLIPSQYNCRYWELMQKYMGVDVPTSTFPGSFDMPEKFYEGILYETSSTRKLFGEFTGYRIYRDVCQLIGEYHPTNRNKPLDQCDWTGNKKAGDLLRQIMSVGSKKPWKEILEGLQNEVDGLAFQQYYEPVWDWLLQDNYKNNITDGWQTVKHC